jgi:adenine-specific DNA-methyltransferase
MSLQPLLFDVESFQETTNTIPYLIPTEGIKYAGSKLKLIPTILELIRPLEIKTVLDGFAGTTRVSQALARSGYQVHSNDVSKWSSTFASCYLEAQAPLSYYQEHIDALNQSAPIYGWYSEHYGCLPEDLHLHKRPWQLKNTMRLDAVRQEIDRLQLNKTDENVLVTSLINALDVVDNTMGHYASYLREWSARSYNDLHLKVPNIVRSQEKHFVTNQSIFDAIQGQIYDLAYLDPPYGSNNEKMPPSRIRYASYYHVYKTICLNDKPELFGKVNRRIDSKDTLSYSPFEDFRKDEAGRFIAVNAISQLIQNVQARYVLLSYSSGGRATAEELENVLHENGTILNILKINYKQNVMAGMQWTKDWIRDSAEPHQEFLFLLEKK